MESCKYTAWLVRDTWGNTESGVINEKADGILVSQMQNPQGYALCFDAEFYHLEKWCDLNGVELITEEGTHIFSATFSDHGVGVVEKNTREDQDDNIGAD